MQSLRAVSQGWGGGGWGGGGYGVEVEQNSATVLSRPVTGVSPKLSTFANQDSETVLNWEPGG